jgi:hypothetical protein
VILGVGLGVASSLVQPPGRPVFVRNRGADAALFGVILGLVAAFVASVVVAVVFSFVDDDSEDRRQAFSPDQPVIVWAMLAVGAVAGLSIRMGMGAGRPSRA